MLLFAGCDSSSGVSFTNMITPPPQIILNWTASSGYPQGYDVEQSSDGVNFTQVMQVPTNSATITNIQTGHVYYYRVRAYNQGGTSAYTSVVNASTISPTPSPS
jgi:hypothetical protein